MELNFLGHPIKWVWVMRKLNTPLSVSSYPAGVKFGAKIFGFPLHLTATWYDRGDIYFDEDEIEQVRQFIRYKIQFDSNYPSKIAKHIFSIAKNIKKQSTPSSKELSADLTNLLSLFDREQKFFLQMIGFMSYRGTIQMSDVLREKVSAFVSYYLAKVGKMDKIDEYLEKLSVPLYQSVIADEKLLALRLADSFAKLHPKQQAQRVQLYLDKYRWLAFHWFVGTPTTADEVRARLMNLSPQAKIELKKIKCLQKRSELEVNKVVKEFRLTSTEKNLLKQYREWIFLRTFVKDYINLAGYKLLPILEAIAIKVGVTQEDVVQLTLDEIFNIKKMSLKEIAKKIKQRHNGFSAGIVNSRLEFRPFSKLNNTTQQPVSEGKIIKGQIACRGTVQGIARVVLSPREQWKLQKGEILITSMTTPDFLPCMERASAFVTDEGGITCHAAIVAREMDKPCVIGTKDATKVLKDGDIVDVDAGNGIVRKI